MSILIKGMKMPKSCEECALWDIDHAYCRVPGVPWTDYFYGEARLDDCPLVEVPPHGRLVDADALKATFCAECNHTITCEDCDIDYHIGRLAPTIIEAEEGEEQ